MGGYGMYNSKQLGKDRESFGNHGELQVPGALNE